MNLRLDINNLIRQLLPNHRRQPVRLFLLRALLLPLLWLYLLFESWRREKRIEINMTGQLGVLEGYLRNKYNSPEITILCYLESGLSIGMHYEGVGHSVAAGLTPPAESQDVYFLTSMNGEVEEQASDVDFIVYIPASLTDDIVEAIRRDVDRYTQIFSTYKMIKQ